MKIIILTGAMLIAVGLAKKFPSRALPPTAPLKNMKWDDDSLIDPPECSVNSTYGQTYTRNGLINKRYRWEDFNVFPDNSFSDEERQKINDAMYNLQQVIPCINFGIWAKGSSPSGDYVHIKKRSGCWSALGRLRRGAQDMSLEAPGCWGQGTIMHEMIHALGFDHEHCRPDRDDYVNIHWDNIESGARSNFEKGDSREFTTFGVEYNIRSIMHYGSDAFSKNRKATITDKRGGTFRANRAGLMETDKLKLKKMYNCQ